MGEGRSWRSVAEWLSEMEGGREGGVGRKGGGQMQVRVRVRVKASSHGHRT